MREKLIPTTSSLTIQPGGEEEDDDRLATATTCNQQKSARNKRLFKIQT
jgi:hypothetical protein